MENKTRAQEILAMLTEAKKLVKGGLVELTSDVVSGKKKFLKGTIMDVESVETKGGGFQVILLSPGGEKLSFDLDSVNEFKHKVIK